MFGVDIDKIMGQWVSGPYSYGREVMECSVGCCWSGSVFGLHHPPILCIILVGRRHPRLVVACCLPVALHRHHYTIDYCAALLLMLL